MLKDVVFFIYSIDTPFKKNYNLSHKLQLF